MNYIQNKIKTGLLLLVASATVISSCNKEPEQFPVTPTTPPSGITIGATIETTDNLFKYKGISIDVESVYRYLDKLNDKQKEQIQNISYNCNRKYGKEKIYPFKNESSITYQGSLGIVFCENRH